MVSVVGTDTASITAKVDVGTEPHGMSIDPTGTFAYVAKASSPSVSVISTGGTDDGGPHRDPAVRLRAGERVHLRRGHRHG